MNVLYLGVENPIESAVPGIPANDIKIVASNGRIRKTETGWSIFPDQLPECIISVMVKNKKITDKTFRVLPLPEPQAVFRGINQGAMSLDRIKEAACIDVKIPDFMWDIEFTVKSFTFMASVDGKEYEETSTGNELTETMMSYLSELKRGDAVAFKNIIAIGPDGREQEVNPLIIKSAP
jgi:hypothetical protein